MNKCEHFTTELLAQRARGEFTCPWCEIDQLRAALKVLHPSRGTWRTLGNTVGISANGCAFCAEG